MLLICQKIHIKNNGWVSMLQFFRSGFSKYFMTALFVVLISSFVLWGGAGDVFRQAASQVAIVGERNVTQNDFQNSFNYRMQRLTARNSEYTKEMAIRQGLGILVENTLVRTASLDEAASRLGLRITDKGLVDYIKNVPALSDNFGNFNRFAFQNMAREQGKTEKQFETLIRKEMIRSELIKTLTDGIKVPTAFQIAVFRLNNEKRSADVVQIIPANIKNIAKITDKDLKKYYDENSSRYMSPEFRTFSYIHIAADNFLNDVTVTDEQVNELYQSRLSDYTTTEKRSVKIMMFDDEAKAGEAAAELSSGKDFDAVNLKLTETTADESLNNAQEQSETEEFFGKESADFIFSSKKGAVSKVINTEFGYRIFKIVKIELGQITPLKDVRITLEIEVRKTKAAEILYNKHAEITESIADGNTVKEIAQALKLPIKKISGTNIYGLNKDQKPVQNLPAISEFLTTAFDVLTGDDAEIYSSTDESQYYMISMEDVTDEAIKPLEDVKEQVKLALEFSIGDKKADEISKEILAKVTGGKKLSEIIKEYPDLKLETISETRIPKKKEIDRLIHKAMFDNEVGKATIARSALVGSYVIVETTASEASKAVPDATMSIQLSKMLRDSYKNDILNIYQSHLNKELPVRVNKAVTRELIKNILGTEDDNEG